MTSWLTTPKPLSQRTKDRLKRIAEDLRRVEAEDHRLEQALHDFARTLEREAGGVEANKSSAGAEEAGEDDEATKLRSAMRRLAYMSAAGFA